MSKLESQFAALVSTTFRIESLTKAMEKLGMTGDAATQLVDAVQQEERSYYTLPEGPFPDKSSSSLAPPFHPPIELVVRDSDSLPGNWGTPQFIIGLSSVLNAAKIREARALRNRE